MKVLLINTTTLWKNLVLQGNTILAFNSCIDFIDFIFLYFYHHLCIYCNRVFSDQSSYVICRCLYRGSQRLLLFQCLIWRMACDVLNKTKSHNRTCPINIMALDKTNQLTGTAYLTIPSRRFYIFFHLYCSLCKVCFLASPFGPFYRPKLRISLPFHIL